MATATPRLATRQTTTFISSLESRIRDLDQQLEVEVYGSPAHEKLWADRADAQTDLDGLLRQAADEASERAALEAEALAWRTRDLRATLARFRADLTVVLDVMRGSKGLVLGAVAVLAALGFAAAAPRVDQVVPFIGVFVLWLVVPLAPGIAVWSFKRDNTELLARGLPPRTPSSAIKLSQRFWDAVTDDMDGPFFWILLWPFIGGGLFTWLSITAVQGLRTGEPAYAINHAIAASIGLVAWLVSAFMRRDS